MAVIAFYRGDNGSFLGDFSSSLIDLNYTIGFNGVASGTALIESKGNVDSLLEGSGENSFFVKFGYEKIYGAVVESVLLDKGVWTVDFIGALGWWGKMHAVPNTFYDGGKVPQGSNSGVMIFYAEDTEGILLEVFRNQALTMSKLGWSSNVIDYSALASSVGHIGNDGVWERSYRLNAFETPTFGSVVEQVISELEDEFFLVSVSNTINTPFKFVVKTTNDSSYHTLYDSWDDVFNIAFDSSNVERRALGVSTGTNLSGGSELAIVENQMADRWAYSSEISSSAAEASDSIERIAESSLEKINSLEGNFSFGSFSEDIDVLDYVDLNVGDYSYTGVVVEVKVNGREVNYSANMTGYSSSGKVSRAPNLERDLIFNPLNEAVGLSGRNARKTRNSTGWRK